MVELTQALGVRFAAARARPDEDFDRAVEQGLDTVDLVYQVPPGIEESGRQLEALMAEADEFCRSAKLITLARGGFQLNIFRRVLAVLTRKDVCF